MKVKQLSLLQHQTGHLETELEKVESNAKVYMNTELDTDPDEELNDFGGIRESMDDAMRKYIEMVVGDEPEKIEELITIQREYEISMGKAHEEFEQECSEIKTKYNAFVTNKLNSLVAGFERDHEELNEETREMIKDMKSTMNDVYDRFNEVAENQRKEMRSMCQQDSSDSSSDGGSSDDENDEDALKRTVEKELVELGEIMKSIGDPDEYKKFRKKILKDDGYLVNNEDQIVAKVLPPPNLDEIVDDETGEKLPSRTMMYGAVDIKSPEDIKLWGVDVEHSIKKPGHTEKS